MGTCSSCCQKEDEYFDKNHEPNASKKKLKSKMSKISR